MTRQEDDAIVLGIHEARDADRVVVLLTAAGDLLPTVAPAAARSRKRFGGALMPGAVVRARWTTRREGTMAILDEAQALEPAPSPDPLDRFYVAAHLIELAREFAREGGGEGRLYRLLHACLGRLREGGAPDTIARYFEAWIVRLAGLMPDLAACAACGRGLAGRALALAPEGGAFCPEHAPAGARRLGRDAAAWLVATRTESPAAVPPPPAAEAALLAEVLTGTITGFTERQLRAWPALVALRRAEGGP